MERLLRWGDENIGKPLYRLLFPNNLLLRPATVGTGPIDPQGPPGGKLAEKSLLKMQNTNSNASQNSSPALQTLWLGLNTRKAEKDLQDLQDTMLRLHLPEFLAHGTDDSSGTTPIDKFISILTKGKLIHSGRMQTYGNLQKGNFFSKNHGGVFVIAQTEEDVKRHKNMMAERGKYINESNIIPGTFDTLEIPITNIDYILLPTELAETARKQFPKWADKIYSYTEFNQFLLEREKNSPSIQSRGLGLNPFFDIWGLGINGFRFLGSLFPQNNRFGQRLTSLGNRMARFEEERIQATRNQNTLLERLESLLSELVINPFKYFLQQPIDYFNIKVYPLSRPLNDDFKIDFITSFLC